MLLITLAYSEFISLWEINIAKIDPDLYNIQPMTNKAWKRFERCMWENGFLFTRGYVYLQSVWCNMPQVPCDAV